MSDSFDQMDRAYGAGVVRNPYPKFAEMRRRGPLAPMAPHEIFDLGIALPRPEGAPPVFTVLSHDAVSEVLRDPGERFSSKAYELTTGPMMGHTILEMDEPEHAPIRGLLQKGFTRKALERWADDLVRPVVSDCVDRFAGRGRADLRRELTFPFPVTVIAGMLGLPERDLRRFHQLAVELISMGFDWERGLAASKELGTYFGRIVDERRREPGDDLISVLAQAEFAGRELSDDAIIAFCRLLLPAGAETTYRSLGNLVFGLLTHTDQLQAIRADRSLIPQAIEEGLRWEPPLTGILRRVAVDTELCGMPLPEGTMLSVCVASANHDETRYERPEEFDIFRPQRQNLAFGFGPHRCLGAHLARIETEVALETLLDRLPDLRLDPEAEDVHITGLIFRSPTELPVLFTPA